MFLLNLCHDFVGTVRSTETVIFIKKLSFFVSGGVMLCGRVNRAHFYNGIIITKPGISLLCYLNAFQVVKIDGEH